MSKLDKPLTVKFSTEQVEKVDQLVAKGLFEKRSQVIRKALIVFLAAANA